MTNSNSAFDPAVFVVSLIVAFVIVAIGIITNWKIFTKAGKPGWASLIPFYSIYVLFQIIKCPLWWIILYFIPIANIIVQLLVAINFAKAFGKGAGFGILLLWLFPIGYLILAFGQAKYAYGSSIPSSTPPVPVGQSQPQP